MDRGGNCPAHSGSVGEFAGQHAGISLLFLEMARWTGDAKWRDLAVSCWQRSVERIASISYGPDFFTGFTGAAWVGDVLARVVQGTESADDADDADDDPLREIDEATLAILEERPPGLPDLLGGISGLGLYMALRTPRPLAQRGLERFIERLEDAAVSDNRGLHWSPDRNLLPREADSALYTEGCVPLGTAHGLAGILSVVARAIEAGVALPGATRLFERGVDFLLASRLRHNNRITFPSSLHRDGSPADPAVSWCWGDVGIIASLHAASLRVGHPDLEKAMVDAAISAVDATPENSPMHDACLCHGTAGRAHILNRLRQRIDVASLADAGRQWVRATLRQRSSEGFGGFTFRVQTAAGFRFLPSPGVLVGSAGVALALLSACSSVQPLWDVPFAIDLSHPRLHRTVLA
jgi:lantibiotic modifying enzyme